MDSTAGIGPSIHIKGDVTASEPLTIAGHVDGTIAVDGHALTVVAGGRVKASVTAHTIVIGGCVRGRHNARALIVVHETATIKGDLSEPAVSFADGATEHGNVETAARRRSAVPATRLSAVPLAA